MYRGEALQLHKVRRKDMGAFMCIASNNVPPTVSRRVSLSVNCEYFIYSIFYIYNIEYKSSFQIYLYINKIFEVEVTYNNYKNEHPIKV